MTTAPAPTTTATAGTSPAVTTTLTTPDGPFTVVVDAAGAVLASGWTDDAASSSPSCTPGCAPRR